MFYTFELEVEKKGKFGSRYYVPFDYKVFAQDSQGELSSYKFPDFVPEFSELILTDSSIEADFINDGGAIGGTGYIISNRVKDLLSDFILPPHRYYSLPYIRQINGNVKKIREFYFWLQIILEDNYDWIDYKKSQFHIGVYIGDKVTPVKINNPPELKKVIKQVDNNEILQCRDLYLNENYMSKKYDLFFFENLSWYPYISQRLKECLEEKEITGLGTIEKRINVHSN